LSFFKTRFHYAKVPAESFNLTPEEILLATDAELNSFMFDELVRELGSLRVALGLDCLDQLGRETVVVAVSAFALLDMGRGH
jgi:hypothetical protein